VIIKLIIIGAIILSGIFLFQSNLEDKSVEVTEIMHSLKNDLNTVPNNMIEKIDKNVITIDESKHKLNADNLSPEKITTIDSLKDVGDFFTGNSDSHDSKKPSDTKPENPNDSNTVISYDKDTKNPSPTPQKTESFTFETLSLSTIEKDSNIVLLYDDSSMNTKSISVTIKNSEKEIFSGVFFSSMFETVVGDTSDIPYSVELTIEHNDYGIVKSSVFNPADSSDTLIHGIFTQN